MCWIAPFTVYAAFEVFLELLSVFTTPKRKKKEVVSHPAALLKLRPEKNGGNSHTPRQASQSVKLNGGDEIMEAMNITEGVTDRLDLIFLKLICLDSMIEELTVEGIQDKVPFCRQRLLLFEID